MKKISDESFIKKNKGKPDSFFFEIILSYIQTEKIEKKLFEVIILEGIEEIDNELFIKYYGTTKYKIKKLIKNSYKKSNGYYELINSISTSKKLQIDEYLKFIRGTITGKSAFTQQEIEKELLSAMQRIINTYKLDINIDSIKANLPDVIICILCILHEAKFNLFDGSEAYSFMSIDKDDENIYKFSLRAEASNFSFPIISTDILVSQYIVDIDLSQFEWKKLPFVTSLRKDDGDLKLIDEQ